MKINGDYPQPVTVNGFTCKNCTDVDYAKKHIDPVHPKDGPYGVNAMEEQGLAELDKAVRGRPTAPKRREWSAPGVAIDVEI